MHFAAIGLNHNTAPVDLREKVAIAPPDLPAALARLRAVPGVSECALLSTCNRTEIYAFFADPTQDAGQLAQCLAELNGMAPQELQPHLYQYDDVKAAEHLFRVAAGLDAMVIGETQILGQVREAYQAAIAAGSAGKCVHHLMSAALAAGKRAQAETGIGQNAVSVSYAAVELVKKLFQGLSQRTVLAVGAGDTAKLTVRHLQSAGAGRILVANRTLERAERLAAKIGGEAISLGAVANVLPNVDVVISSTGAPSYVVTRAMVQAALRQRRGRPIFLFDIAVPRDIDPDVSKLDGAFLYDLDDLQQVVAENLDERLREARQAERILQDELKRFQEWHASQEVIPTIRSLRDKVESIRAQEVKRALARMPELPDRERAIVEAMTQAITNKILNDPTQKLKGLAVDGEAAPAAAAINLLFDLNRREREQTSAEDRPAPADPEGSASPQAPSAPVRGTH